MIFCGTCAWLHPGAGNPAVASTAKPSASVFLRTAAFIVRGFDVMGTLLTMVRMLDAGWFVILGKTYLAVRGETLSRMVMPLTMHFPHPCGGGKNLVTGRRLHRLLIFIAGTGTQRRCVAGQQAKRRLLPLHDSCKEPLESVCGRETDYA